MGPASAGALLSPSTVAAIDYWLLDNWSLTQFMPSLPFTAPVPPFTGSVQPVWLSST
jgi:hypothetical protein